MLHRHKTKLWEWLVRMWMRIENTKIPDLPKLMARAVIRAHRKVLGPKRMSVRSALIVVGVSVLLTFVAVVGGSAFEEFHRSEIEIRESLWESMLWEANDLLAAPFTGGMFRLFGINLCFDLATVAISLALLGVIQGNRSAVGACVVVLDAFVAYILAAGCLSSVLWFNGHEVESLVEVSVQAPWEAIKLAGEGFDGLRVPLDLRADFVFYSATTLIPTVAYLSVFAFLFIARPLIQAGRKTTLFFLERTTEDDPLKMIPFTLLGIVLTVCAALAKVVQEVFRAISQG